jgi:hypothetical protein
LDDRDILKFAVILRYKYALLYPTQKVNVLDAAFQNLQEKSYDVDSVDDDFIKSMASITRLPLPKKQNQIDDTFDWIRQNDVRLAEIDDRTFQALAGVSHVD